MEESGTTEKLGNRIELARLYEAKAVQAVDDRLRLGFYRKAAAAHHELGSYLEEARCLSLACSLLDGEEKVDCLVSRWNVYITAIAVYKYETGFEWKGKDENLDPHYEESLRGYYDGAVDTLDEALRTTGVDRERLLEKLYAECVKRRNDRGWGESECFSSIDEAFRGRRFIE